MTVEERKHKRFIVWIDYGSEGWSILHESDTWEEAADAMTAAMVDYSAHGYLITEYRPWKIVPDDEGGEA